MAALPCIPLIAALGIALSGCGETKPAATPGFYATLAAPGASVDPVAARDMISVYRRGNGLPTLTIDPALQAEAQSRATAMAQAGSNGADRDESFKKRLAGVAAGDTGAGDTGAGARRENISAGYHTLAEAFSGWRESRRHNANMLDPAATRLGIATAYNPGGKYKVYWVMILSR